MPDITYEFYSSHFCPLDEAYLIPPNRIMVNTSILPSIVQAIKQDPSMNNYVGGWLLRNFNKNTHFDMEDAVESGLP